MTACNAGQSRHDENSNMAATHMDHRSHHNKPAILTQLQTARRRMLDLLLPQDCLLCLAPARNQLLCPACHNDLPWLPKAVCPICALPTVAGAVCGACLSKPPAFDATLASFRYSFPLDRLIQTLKYRHNLATVEFLATALQQTAAPHAMDVDLLLALPLSAQRLAARGFNQSLELARPLAQELQLPLAVAGYSRTLNTPPQARLPWQARQKNIRGAFRCALDLSDKHVVVIDDVMTTGATLNEFARTLKKQGARRVSNWVVARALREG